MLSYLLFDQSLLDQVKKEVDASWSEGILDLKSLCKNSSTLDAVFHEALRLKGGAMMSRKVTARTELGGKILEPGNSIIIPSRQLHTNPKVWGSNSSDFEPFRFAKKKSLIRHSSYRPFGGGVTYCPGRALAREEVFGFIAILLHRFHVQLASCGKEKQQFPRLDDSTPALGITGPVKGMDVLIEMSEAMAGGFSS